MPNRTQSPEHRARQQLRDLRAEVLKSAKELGKSYQNPERTSRILTEHQQRVAGIVQQGRQQPRITARQARRQASRDLPLAINLLWSAMMIAGVILVSWATGWEAWPLLLPFAVWVIVGAFVWTIAVPALLFVGVVLFEALLVLHL
jgi:hypothetical protein